MTQQIIKHVLSVGANKIEMPEGSSILTAQMQRDQIVLWTIGSIGYGSTERRLIGVVGTGSDLEDDVGTYVATVQEGSFVWHVLDCGVE